MKDMQKVFLSLQDKKKQLKELKKQFTEECGSVSGWDNLMTNKSELNTKLKQIRINVAEKNTGLANSIYDLKIDIDSEKEMLNDIVLSKFMKGETIEVEDQYKNTYQPSFSLIFKKDF